MAFPSRAQPQAATASVLEQINAELFTLTYGSMVRQLISDLEDVDEVNKQLDKMGHGMGRRIVDEFLAKSKLQRCTTFKSTVDVVAKHAFYMFLNVQANVTDWNKEETECMLVLNDNPLSDFVELPDEWRALKYSNVLCGIIRGALETLNINVECSFEKDMLQGDAINAIRLKCLSIDQEELPFKEDD